MDSSDGLGYKVANRVHVWKRDTRRGTSILAEGILGSILFGLTAAAIIAILSLIF